MDEEPLKDCIDKLHGQDLETTLDQVRQAVKAGDTKQVTMAIPMLLALTICPAMLGTQEAIRQSQSKTKREEHRSRRCNLVASCVRPSIRSRDINDKLVVLRDSKLYIASQSSLSGDNDEDTAPGVDGHLFAGYFLPYPDSSYEGMVSTIVEEPPILNWIYIDRDTHEVKYGLRVDAQDHVTGPFDCTKQDRRMTLEGWEGFLAVEEFPGVWALYFDRDDDGLQGRIPFGTRVLEIELSRREKKERKPRPDPDQARTLDQMMAQHKEKSRREEEEKGEFINEDAARGLASTEEEGATREKQGIDTCQDQAELQAVSGEQPSAQELEILESGDWAQVKQEINRDGDSVGSKTAVPSTWGDDADSGGIIGEKCVPGTYYQRPYVEDVAQT